MCDPWATACTTATETNRGSLSARSKNEYPPTGRQLRGRPPHPAAEPAGAGGSADAGGAPVGERVMLSDALTSQQAAGSAPESVEVVDVAQMLLVAVRRGTPA